MTASRTTFADIRQQLGAEVPLPKKGKRARYDVPLVPSFKATRRSKTRPPSDRQPVVMIGFKPANDHPAPARRASRTPPRPTDPTAYDPKIYTTGKWGPSGLRIGCPFA